MFDVGFSEMLVIGVVALVVIGPDRLPKVAKTVGHLMGRMQRYVADVKADINREVEMSELKDLKRTMEDAAASVNSAVTAHANEISEEIKKTEEEFNRLSNPMVHFGLAGSGASAPVHSSEHESEEALSPPSQMELGLSDVGTSANAELAPESRS